jgi:hypothetical protein
MLNLQLARNILMALLLKPAPFSESIQHPQWDKQHGADGNEKSPTVMECGDYIEVHSKNAAYNRGGSH